VFSSALCCQTVKHSEAMFFPQYETPSLILIQANIQNTSR